MSRIGKLPVIVPKNVNIELTGKEITVKGAHGELNYTIPDEIDVSLNENNIIVSKNVETRLARQIPNHKKTTTIQAIKSIIILQRQQSCNKSDSRIIWVLMSSGMLTPTRPSQTPYNLQESAEILGCRSNRSFTLAARSWGILCGVFVLCACVGTLGMPLGNPEIQPRRF